MSKKKTNHIESHEDILKQDLDAISHFDTTNMQEALELFPSDYAVANEGLLQANSSLHKAKAHLERLESQLYLQLRSKADLEGKKLTEKALAASISVAPNVIQARDAVATHGDAVERYKSALRVLDKKERSMELVSRFQIREMGNIARYS